MTSILISSARLNSLRLPLLSFLALGALVPLSAHASQGSPPLTLPDSHDRPPSTTFSRATPEAHAPPIFGDKPLDDRATVQERAAQRGTRFTTQATQARWAATAYVNGLGEAIKNNDVDGMLMAIRGLDGVAFNQACGPPIRVVKGLIDHLAAHSQLESGLKLVMIREARRWVHYGYLYDHEHPDERLPLPEQEAYIGKLQTIGNRFRMDSPLQTALAFEQACLEAALYSLDDEQSLMPRLLGSEEEVFGRILTTGIGPERLSAGIADQAMAIMKQVRLEVRREHKARWYNGVVYLLVLQELAKQDENALGEIQSFLHEMEKKGRWQVLYAGVEALAEVIIHTDSDRLRQSAYYSTRYSQGFEHYASFDRYGLRQGWHIRYAVIEKAIIMHHLLRSPSFPCRIHKRLAKVMTLALFAGVSDAARHLLKHPGELLATYQVLARVGSQEDPEAWQVSRDRKYAHIDKDIASCWAKEQRTQQHIFKQKKRFLKVLERTLAKKNLSEMHYFVSTHKSGIGEPLQALIEAWEQGMAFGEAPAGCLEQRPLFSCEEKEKRAQELATLKRWKAHLEERQQNAWRQEELSSCLALCHDILIEELALHEQLVEAVSMEDLLAGEDRSGQARDKQAWLSQKIEAYTSGYHSMFFMESHEKEIWEMQSRQWPFWNEILAQECPTYLPLKGARISMEGNQEPIGDVKNYCLEQFLHQEHSSRVVLLLAATGRGKSAFVHALTTSLWRMFEAHPSPDCWLPVYIPVCLIRSPFRLISEYMQRTCLFEGEFEAFRQGGKTLFILDGYEELPETHRLNLYTQSNLQFFPGQIKVIITCRKNILGRNYRNLFVPYIGEPTKAFEEIELLPFDKEQQAGYIERCLRYGEHRQEAKPIRYSSADRYMEVIHALPKLHALAREPFFLRLMVDSLPAMWQEGESVVMAQDRIASALYEECIAATLARESRKLALTYDTARKPFPFDSVEEAAAAYRKYMEQLIRYGRAQGKSFFTQEDWASCFGQEAPEQQEAVFHALFTLATKEEEHTYQFYPWVRAYLESCLPEGPSPILEQATYRQSATAVGGAPSPSGALHKALQEGPMDEALMKIMSAEAYALDAPDEQGHRPLHLAVARRATTLVSFLLERGADPNLLNAAGATALDIAHQQGDKVLFALLEARGAQRRIALEEMLLVD